MLCILAIFKNEAIGIVEWLDYYIQQGVSHFFLLDNNSTDNYKEKISNYDQVTIIHATKNFAQKEHYNSCISLIKKYDFVLVVDIDEFMYVKGLNITLEEYTKSIPQDISQVSVSWSMFSSSNLVSQPLSVLKSFTWRWKDFGCDVKSIVRIRDLIVFDIHKHRVSGRSILDDSNLQLNHYVIQSLEFWQNVKMTRGDVIDNFVINPRDMNYFNKYDRSEVLDTELSTFIIPKKIRVISFALWGDSPMFTIGAIHNAELALKYYPDFICIFYVHKLSVPEHIIQRLLQLSNVKIIFKDVLPESKGRGCAWRFEAYDIPEVELFMSRDTDTRFLPREVLAVREWIESKKLFHIMRDSPCHYPCVLGGMFGCRKIPGLSNMTVLIDKFFQDSLMVEYNSQLNSIVKQYSVNDQNFIENIVYPMVKHSVIIHDEIKKYEGDICRPFPIKYDQECNFVGQYIFEDDQRHEERYQPNFVQIQKNYVNTYLPERIEKPTYLERCVVACDLNPLYLDFFPLVKMAWKNIVGIETTLILIANEIPDSLIQFKQDIILFPPIENIPTAFQAQCIRLLYPSLLSVKGSIIISDMDLIPLSKKYYTSNIGSDSSFVVYRSDCIPNEYPMCFCAAVPEVWKLVFNISNINEIKQKLIDWYAPVTDYKISGPYSKGWALDQSKLFIHLQEFKKLYNLVLLRDIDTGFNRLDRQDIDIIAKNAENIKYSITQGHCTDFHLPRPLKDYQTIINNLLNISPTTFASKKKSSKMIVINRQLSGPEYGTHMAPLLTAILHTDGPVFEMGCGDYSTPMLHAICKRQNRFLLSSDTSKEWINLFLDMENDMHSFVYVSVFEDDWEKNPKPDKWDLIGNQKWGVVFIDHRPGDRRAIDIKRFANLADVIVVHDTEAMCYGYEPVMNTFKYRYDYLRYQTRTTLVSNKIDIREFFNE